MNKTIKIMLVEDSAAYRSVIDQSLEDEPDLELVSQFSTSEAALRSLQDMSARIVPDLILLDIGLPGMSGIEAILHFKKYIPDTHIIMLTQSNNESDVLTAIQTGASGYFLKASTLDQLTEGIRTVMEGGAPIDPKVAMYIVENMRRKRTETDLTQKLTNRELEILTLISEGLIKKEVADRLNISSKTVAAHVCNIYEKLDVTNAASAVNLAHKSGIFLTPW